MAKQKHQNNQQKEVNIDFESLFSKIGLESNTSLIEAFERKRESRFLAIVYNENAQVSFTPSMLPTLENVLASMGHVGRLDVFLRSTGGVTEVPWRIVSLVREFCEHFGVVVAGIALSGATHVAIAGDELIMGPFATLGPVDPTRMHPLLPKDNNNNPIPMSVQDLKDLIDFLKEQLGDSYHDASIITKLFEYVNPLAIGALEQSYKLSKLITRKVLETRNKPLTNDEITKVQDTLASKYYSHSFQISRSDVEKDLGLEVLKPDKELSEIIQSLLSYYNMEFNKQYSDPSQTHVTANVAGFIQNKVERHVIVQIRERQAGQVIIDPWVKL
jgi:hypothetical protein